MTQWLMPILTALLGYLAHWGQTAMARRHKRLDADGERVLAIRDRLIELRDIPESAEVDGVDDHFEREHQSLELAKRLTTEVGLVSDTELRSRVAEDLWHILQWWVLKKKFGSMRVRRAEAQDAIDCCSAALRGARLPRPSNELQYLRYCFGRELVEAMPKVDWLRDELMTYPEVQEAEDRRQEWEVRRRSANGWRRHMPSKRAKQRPFTPGWLASYKGGDLPFT
ncbi:hypothetical protein OHB35_44890 [Streptomyces phaeochromogenes]|uniref:Uncharacterized protein n=1 Tax=Streptomyces phaeochromogenes TaxID=1923 RepID=A0ABZ1HMG2_STRPH|nr:hypothetical protein [Streptomyces phaeochromogenes]WSD19801.1 hypothetical protein OHB35_44890 [Streptomyces phaeochromogenes]